MMVEPPRLYFNKHESKYYVLYFPELQCSSCGSREEIYVLVDNFYKSKSWTADFLCFKCFKKKHSQLNSLTRAHKIIVIYNEPRVNKYVIPYILTPPEIAETSRSNFDIFGLEREHRELHQTQHIDYNPQGITLDGAQIGKDESEVSREENGERPANLLDELAAAEPVDELEDKRKEQQRITHSHP